VQIRKAVITAGGRGVRVYPAADTVQKAMLPLVDRDGLNKPVIQIIAEEALDSGIEEICVVCAPGDEAQYRARFELLRNNLVATYGAVDWAREQEERLSNLLKRLHFAPQKEPLGYGHAVHCTKDFVGREPFLLLLGDHLYVSHAKVQRCAQQLIDLATREECAVAAVHATPEHMVGHYGTVSGKRVPNQGGVYQIERILEKPSLSRAELDLHVPGLRIGHYLCFFGMHVLTPSIFDLLGEKIEANAKRKAETLLTPSLEDLAKREKYLALEVEGTRYDIGAVFGLLRTQIALALAGRERDRALTTILEVMSESSRHQDGPEIAR
jgi:UTP--glucose-1-phosphate uridylyltransferase